MDWIATREIPVGYSLPSLVRHAIPQIMRSRQWTGTNRIHWDEEYARSQGLSRPVGRGQMTSAHIQDMCIRFFGPRFFFNAAIEIKFVKPVFWGDTLTAGGVVREKRVEGDGFRFVVDVWCENQHGEKVTVGVAEAFVE